MGNRRNATLALLVLGVTGMPASAQKSGPREFKPPVHQVAPSLDKVQMESFVSEPAQIPAGTAQVLLRVIVKNVTNSNGAAGSVLNGLKVKIFRTNPQPDVLELETTVNNLAAGATQSVAARVNLAPGVREYFARVDPDDTLHEPVVQRANNEKRLRINIPQPLPAQAAAAPARETQLLDFDKAKRSGARFGGSAKASLCEMLVVDAKSPDLSSVPGRPAAGVFFNLRCGQLPVGARSDPEAFTSFRLKNGWKVKSFDVTGVRKLVWPGSRPASEQDANWQWTKTPSVATDDPSAKLHLWTNANRAMQLFVKVEIEGPAGTNPYQ